MSQDTELAKDCFDNSPCGMLLTDAGGNILRANPALQAMLGLTSQQLAGHNPESLPFPAYRGLLKDEGLIHLMGPGVETERWLQCRTGKHSDPAVKFFQDVTELIRITEQNEQLRRQVEDLTVTDELTGLANPRAFNRALTTQVTRSRRYQNPLSLALVELTDDHSTDAQPADEGILTASHFLRDRLRWVDVIARWDHNHFLVILPETEGQAASDLIGKIRDGFAETQATSTNPGLRFRYGLSTWQKGDDENKLMDRAAANLNNSDQDHSASVAS